MKSYIENLDVDISAERAWEGLKHMNKWLPLLSTNKAVKYDLKGAFFHEGRLYDCVSKEGVVMHAEIIKIDEENLSVEIRAEHKPLVSLLSCSIERLSDTSCRLVRKQSYPGFFGFLFTTFFNRREAGETGEYLKVWAEYSAAKQDKK